MGRGAAASPPDVVLLTAKSVNSYKVIAENR